MNKTGTQEERHNRDSGSEKDLAADIKSGEGEKGNEASAPGEQDSTVGKLTEDLEAAKDKYIRLYSEFENFRKRTAKEKLDLIQSANEQLLRALLPVVDDFERAENSFPEKTDSDLAGFFLIHSKLKKIIEMFGVKTMETTRGSEFDADLHDAITQVPAPTPDLKGKIVDVVEKGYVLNERVIRHAKVVVGN